MDLIKPIENKVSALSVKFDALLAEIREVKSILPIIKTVSANSSASSTPCSAVSTPSSRPARTQAPAPRKPRASAIRTKERLATFVSKPSNYKQKNQQQIRIPEPQRIQTTMTIQNDNAKYAEIIKRKSDQFINDRIRTNNVSNQVNNALLDPEPKTNCERSSTEPSNKEIAPEEPGLLPPKTRHQRRRNVKPTPVSIKGTAKNTEVTGVEVLRYLHGCYFKHDSTPENIISHLKSVCDDDQYTVEAIPSKRNTYRSFKIGIPTNIYDNFLTDSAWPLNTCINQWRPFLRPREPRAPNADAN